MKTLNFLIDLLINFLPGFVNGGGCICSVLDHLFIDKKINIHELKLLNHQINNFIETDFLDNVIDTGNYSLFIAKLQTLKDNH